MTDHPEWLRKIARELWDADTHNCIFTVDTICTALMTPPPSEPADPDVELARVVANTLHPGQRYDRDDLILAGIKAADARRERGE